MELSHEKTLNIEFIKKITDPFWWLLISIALLPFVSNEIMLLIGILVVLNYMVNKMLSPKLESGLKPFASTPIDYPLIVYILVQIISTITSVSPKLSMQNLAVSLIGIAIYYIIVDSIKTKARLDKLIKLFMIIAFLLSCLGILQYFTLGATSTTWVDIKTNPDLKTRVIGTFGNPNVFAEYLEHILPVAMALVIAYKSKSKKIITAIMFITMLICLVLTFSRAAWIGFAGAVGLFLLLKYASMIPIGIMMMVAAIPFMPKIIIQRILSINLSDTSNSYRMYIWEGTMNMIRDFWKTGVGFGYWAFKNTFMEYSIKGTRAWHSHNLYLEILAEIGLFGFLSFIWLIIATFSSAIKFIKRTKDKYLSLLSTGLICGIFSVMIHGVAEHILYMPKSVFIFWMMLGFLMTTINLEKLNIYNHQ